MSISRGILIGIIVGVLTSGALALSYDFSEVDAMSGMDSSSSSGDSKGGDSGGMKGSPSKHGVFYAPGTTHQICKNSGAMPPHYCEPYYKAMSSVVGVKISYVEPVNEKTLRVTLRTLSDITPSVNQKISLSAGAGDLAGTAVVDGGWSGKTTVDVPLLGMGHIYNHESMHVHIFPVTSG